MKPTDILKHIDEIESQWSYYGRFKTVYALVCSLPDKALMQYVETHSFPEVFMKVIARRGLKEQFASRQKMTVSRYITLLSNLDCKNKTSLRDGLKARYNLVPPAYKERILRCMLAQNTKKERLWAYTRLRQKWDNSFFRTIEQCFETYHEVECAWLILDFFPTPYIYEHREVLAGLVGWRWIMSRVGKDYPNLVSCERLTASEWVRVVVDLHMTEHEADIEAYLYNNIAVNVEKLLAKGVYALDLLTIKNQPFTTAHDYPLSLRSIPDVSWTVWAMGQMGMADAIMRFKEYDHMYEHHVPEDYDEETKAKLLYSWLSHVYDTFAVKMLGWPSREEKGYSFETYLNGSDTFIPEDDTSAGDWLEPTT